MLIDCDTCAVRGLACPDCVVTVLLGAPPAAAGDGVELDGPEQAAIAMLAGSGLVPPLRLRPVPPPGPVPATGDHEAAATAHRPSPRRPPRDVRRAAG